MADQVVQAVGPATTRPAGLWEVAGILNAYEALEGAVDEPLLAGFARCELRLLSKQSGPQADEAAAMPAAHPAAQRTDHFCTEALGNAAGALVSGFAIVPAFGTAAAGAAAGVGLLATAGLAIATAGTGALVGAALAALVVRRRQMGFNGQASQGGLLLWVRTVTPALEASALDILRRHAGHHIHAHDLPAFQ
jgi:hypothetical protein